MNDDRPPLVFTDVDGVINGLGNSRGVLPPNQADRYATVKIDGGLAGEVIVRYRPDLVARLRDLSDRGRAEFCWLTSWRHTAREHLAPAIGLPNWPAIPHPIDVGDDSDAVAAHPWDRNRPWWKLEAVLNRTAGINGQHGRRFAWLDDDLPPETKTTVRLLRPQPSLLITPPTSLGLTNQLVTQLEVFCGLERDDEEA